MIENHGHAGFFLIEVMKQKIMEQGNKCLSIIISSFEPSNLLSPLGYSQERNYAWFKVLSICVFTKNANDPSWCNFEEL